MKNIANSTIEQVEYPRTHRDLITAWKIKLIDYYYYKIYYILSWLCYSRWNIV